MEKLQGLIREYGDNLIKQLQKVPDGLAHIEPWITNRRENYASAVAAYIMSYLYWKEGASRYLECFSGLIKHSVSLLKKENTKTSSFAKVFILNYSLMAILTLPEKERKVYTNLTLNEFESFKDECPAINTNCAALQYGNEIFLSCMNPERKNIFFLDCLLNHVEKSQNHLGFINDSCGEGEQDSDGMPIAYHMFICYLLLNVLLMNGQYHVLPIGHGERVRNIISAGIKWLTYATFEAGDVAMAERSRYQVFTMGVQAALTAVSFPEKVECVVDQLIRQYGFDQNASHCTPNNFPPSMRVGYENYTRTNDYNNLNIAGFITSDLCLELGMRILGDDVISDRRLFCDTDSGYAFYRNEYGFMGIVLRNHTGGYLSQGTGFHYRLKKCQLPLAEPTDNAVGTISEAVKIKGSLSDVCGGGVCCMQ